MSLRSAAIPVLLWAAACGARHPSVAAPEVEVPERSRTAGDELLALAPAGADLVVEVDLERLRQNQTLGPLVRDWAESGGLHLGFDLVGGADAVLVAVYGLGDGKPSYLTIVRGPKASRLPRAEKLDPETVAIGAPAMLDRVRAVGSGEGATLTGDAELLRARTLAMPAKAPGASLRVAGHFDFDARVAISRTFELEAVPTAVSVWGDVADDLAVVGLFRGADENEAHDLVKVLTALRERAATSPILSNLVLGYVVRSADIHAEGKVAEAVLLVGPRRLGRIAARLKRRLEEPKP